MWQNEYFHAQGNKEYNIKDKHTKKQLIVDQR